MNICQSIIYHSPPKGMVLHESFCHQYAILLRNYGITINQAIIHIVRTLLSHY